MATTLKQGATKKKYKKHIGKFSERNQTKRY